MDGKITTNGNIRKVLIGTKFDEDNFNFKPTPQ